MKESNHEDQECKSDFTDTNLGRMVKASDYESLPVCNLESGY